MPTAASYAIGYQTLLRAATAARTHRGKKVGPYYVRRAPNSDVVEVGYYLRPTTSWPKPGSNYERLYWCMPFKAATAFIPLITLEPDRVVVDPREAYDPPNALDHYSVADFPPLQRYKPPKGYTWVNTCLNNFLRQRCGARLDHRRHRGQEFKGYAWNGVPILGPVEFIPSTGAVRGLHGTPERVVDTGLRKQLSARLKEIYTHCRAMHRMGGIDAAAALAAARATLDEACGPNTARYSDARFQTYLTPERTRELVLNLRLDDPVAGPHDLAMLAGAINSRPERAFVAGPRYHWTYSLIPHEPQHLAQLRREIYKLCKVENFTLR